MHHPIAHLTVCMRVMRAAMAALIGDSSWEGYKLISSVRSAAEGVMVEAELAAETAIVEVREFVGEVGLTPSEAVKT